MLSTSCINWNAFRIRMIKLGKLTQEYFDKHASNSKNEMSRWHLILKEIVNLAIAKVVNMYRMAPPIGTVGCLLNLLCSAVTCLFLFKHHLENCSLSLWIWMNNLFNIRKINFCLNLRTTHTFIFQVNRFWIILVIIIFQLFDNKTRNSITMMINYT